MMYCSFRPSTEMTWIYTRQGGIFRTTWKPHTIRVANSDFWEILPKYIILVLVNISWVAFNSFQETDIDPWFFFFDWELEWLGQVGYWLRVHTPQPLEGPPDQLGPGLFIELVPIKGFASAPQQYGTSTMSILSIKVNVTKNQDHKNILV